MKNIEQVTDPSLREQCPFVGRQSESARSIGDTRYPARSVIRSLHHFHQFCFPRSYKRIYKKIRVKGAGASRRVVRRLSSRA